MKFKKRAGAGEGSAHFISFKDKETRYGVFRGEPFTFWQHWGDDGSVVCSGRSICKLCHNGEKASFRFAINFITLNPETKLREAKILEQGSKFYDSLQALETAGYDLDLTIISITRSGIDKTTKYAVVPIKDSQLTPDKKALIDAVPLHDLVKAKTPQEQPPMPDNSMEPATSFMPDDEVTF